MKKDYIIIVLLIIIGIISFHNFKVSGDISKLEQKIDSLSIKKDSIRTIIVNIDKEIIKNEKHYEKVVDTILTSNDSINYIWTKQYIEQYRQKLK